MVSYLGGMCDLLVVVWLVWIWLDGCVCSQFIYCIDIVLIVLVVIGLLELIYVDGFEQELMDGISFVWIFDDVEVEDCYIVQYFENFGSCVIYKDGWWVCVCLDKVFWDLLLEMM